MCVPPFGEVCEADLAFDALFVTTDAATRCTRLTGAAGVAEHLRNLSPVALYGWVLARRVYAAGQRMPAQTMLLFDREDRNTLVAIYARDRDKYDAERFVRIDSATSRRTISAAIGQPMVITLPSLILPVKSCGCSDTSSM